MQIAANYLPRYSVTAGQRSLALSLPGHTKDHVDCPVCAQCEQPFSTSLSAKMTLREAAEAYLHSIRPPEELRRFSTKYVAPRTWRSTKEHFGRLDIFFENIPLAKLRVSHFRSYQEARLMGDGFTRNFGKNRIEVSPCGPTTINHELGLLQRLLRLTGLWTIEFDRLYKPLPEPDRDIPRALTIEEQERFLDAAASNPHWSLVYWYSLVALDLMWRSDEMRNIRQGDCNLHFNVIGINSRTASRRIHREMDICNADAVWAVAQLVKRSVQLVGSSPDRYVFPFLVCRSVYDGSRPISPTGLRKSFEQVRTAANVPWFGLNGWRHTAATRMAEAGMHISVIAERMGDCSSALAAHYSHISKQAQRLAIANATKRPSRSTASLAALAGD